MPTFFNPAAGLTANRVAIAAGGGRLKDASALSYAAGKLDVFQASGTSEVRLYDGNVGMAGRANTLELYGYAGRHITLNTGGVERVRLFNGGSLALGATVDRYNGLMQLAAHTTQAGGFGFYDFALYRTGAQSARLTAQLVLNDFFSIFSASRQWNFAATGGSLIIAAQDSAGDIRLRQNTFIGDAGVERQLFDCDGNRILRKRYAAPLSTLADVIACLQWHGLSA